MRHQVVTNHLNACWSLRIRWSVHSPEYHPSQATQNEYNCYSYNRLCNLRENVLKEPGKGYFPFFYNFFAMTLLNSLTRKAFDINTLLSQLEVISDIHTIPHTRKKLSERKKSARWTIELIKLRKTNIFLRCSYVITQVAELGVTPFNPPRFLSVFWVACISYCDIENVHLRAFSKTNASKLNALC